MSRSITTLVEFGFVKTHHIRIGVQERTKYYIQACCWNPALMNSKARAYRRAKAKCLACLLYVERADYGISGDAKVHYGCGGFVISVAEREMPRKQIPWRDRIGGEETQWEDD